MVNISRTERKGTWGENPDELKRGTTVEKKSVLLMF